MNLDFTRIAAPITGKISRTLLTAGNLVNADTTLLTTIMSIDPMYAYFNVEEPTLLRIQTMKREGVIQQQLSQVDVEMGLADDVERKFPLRGMLDFANNTVDPQTGTILVRGAFANPYELPDRPPVLMPGLFVRVRLEHGAAAQGVPRDASGPSAPTKGRSTSTSSTRTTRSSIAASYWGSCSTVYRRSKKG